ncbi:MAG: undecaprenyldiphospho-muramoylpentapeptide beta-N-acetylglucosaminyltransferase [bacterium]|nr:undecaprenyldiphospho-muramoylpentapeptide beta-N-acetylglucosaminyltransferase [bacterium]MDD5354009.1 undecaprenyldiphospho-muramoylpentapeptide beta-N-acetylglucosaminyltransferase [bacterium]MDD5755922.1 undecaprenyldiphospho-muramoylpentapeptide beta-N-acetylglucosaminyltransferase [bacterium]
MRVLIVAGGTGGHLYPGVSVAKKLKEKNHQVLMVIRDKDMEKEIVNKYQLEFATIAGIGLKKSISGLLKFGWQFLKGLNEAHSILDRFKPEVILALGNYLSLPIALAGQRKNIPVVLHEQNCLPGKATRFLAKKASKICISFKESLAYLEKFKSKIIITGNPLRPEMVSAPAVITGKPIRNILVFGGSQGAHSINLAMLSALDRLELVRAKVTITHLAGVQDLPLVENGYRERNFDVMLASYLHDMQEAYAKASLVVARAGAATLAELAFFGLPSILIPYPFAAEDHQRINAAVLVNAGAARMIMDKDLNGEILASSIIEIIQNGTVLQYMSAAARKLAQPQAAENIVRVLNEIISSK